MLQLEIKILKFVKVEMPPLFSLMTPAASIARIQRTNLPQTPKRCNDCIHEDKWFNSKDGLLVSRNRILINAIQLQLNCQLLLPGM